MSFDNPIVRVGAQSEGGLSQLENVFDLLSNADEYGKKLGALIEKEREVKGLIADLDYLKAFKIELDEFKETLRKYDEDITARERVAEDVKFRYDDKLAAINKIVAG